jgi:hypothetical protein
MPAPIRTPTGSQKPRKLGVSGSASVQIAPAAARISAPPLTASRGVVRRAAASATAAATTAPGVMASPASSGE